MFFSTLQLANCNNPNNLEVSAVEQIIGTDAELFCIGDLNDTKIIDEIFGKQIIQVFEALKMLN